MTTAVITFDVTLFRQMFPPFSNVTTYPTDMLQTYWDTATCFISNRNCGSLTGICRQKAINYMVAHLLQLMINIGPNANNAKTPYILASATIDKITVTTKPPEFKNDWQWWLATTPYGMTLYALLFARSVGGFYIGGLPERAAFRSVAGIFPTPLW
jgi:hypothetical protein